MRQQADGPNSMPTRPMLRYHGGKWRLAPWIISHFPAHRIYVEPYGGAGSVLLRKQRSYSEVFNDKWDELLNLFRIVRDDPAPLIAALYHTPYSRKEYILSFELSEDSLEQARRTVVRSYMGFGSNSLQRAVKSGFRACSNRSGTTPAHDWMHFPSSLSAIVERLRGVVLDNRDALDIIRQHDDPETLHYCDPPYVHSTRTAYAGKGARSGYQYEMSDEDHQTMGVVLSGLRGKVIVSGYESPIYRDLFSGWRTARRATFSDRARSRIEMLWMNF